MTVSRKEFGEALSKELLLKLNKSLPAAALDDEYSSYTALAELLEVEGDIEVSQDPTGGIQILFSPKFQIDPMMPPANSPTNEAK